MSGLVIRGAEVAGRVVDVRVRDGVVAASAAGLVPEPGEDVIDAGGGALIPGLHDHHIHLLAYAAARTSVRLGPPEIVGAVRFTRALRQAHLSLPDGAWLRGSGYHESVAGDLDRHRIDEVVADRPVRIQHRSGALWILNTRATELTGLESADHPGIERDNRGRPTGRLWRLDSWLRDRLPAEPLDLAAAAHQLAAYGITGLTDATPTERPEDITLLADAVADGRIPQRLVLTGGLGLTVDTGPSTEEGRPTPGPRPEPWSVARVPALEFGPVKLVVADHEFPVLDDLAGWIATAHGRERPVAVHCVTRVALLLALAAWDEVGAQPGDRVEHAAVAGPGEAERLARLGITVVTQPGFIAERGDTYLAEVDPADLPDLWPCASLVAHGVAVGAGTDAPFGPADPWLAIATAANRHTPRRVVLGPDERISPTRALTLFTTPPEAPGGAPRRVAPGERADLCLLHSPLAAALAHPAATGVSATIRAGRVIHP